MKRLILFICICSLIGGTRTFAALTTEEAIQKAKSIFNVTNQEINYIKTDRDFELIRGKNQECYKIEILILHNTYKIIINKENGEIYKIEIENKEEGLNNIFNEQILFSIQHPIQSSSANINKNKNENEELTLQQAIQMIIKKCQGITEQQIIIEQDIDDGRLQYKGKANYNNIIYEFEIDCKSKQFTKWKKD